MNEIYNLKCEACGFESQYHSSLNKHLSKCEKYEEWIKTYKPPTQFICRGCEKAFINKKIYEKHVYECYIK